VARRNQTPVSGLWLTGWILIAIHFASFMFVPAPGIWGLLALLSGLISLIGAGILFTWAAVPYRRQPSSRWMLAALLISNSLYIVIISVRPNSWTLIPAAAAFGAFPLAILLATIRKFNHPLRWFTVFLGCALSLFLLLVQYRPGNGADLAENAVLFTVYIGCCGHFLYMYRRATAGAFVTIAGFLAWASVFVVGPTIMTLWPDIHIENEVWNLPKYVVAVGMILLLLEDQIEHNKYLALHDEMTGLPNRRLFQDRLASALERARRTETQTCLLVVDLDRFKQVNDSLGHHVGDLVLQRAGSIFSSRVRRSDTVARTGGDEFSIILEEPTCREEALHVGQSLLELLNEPQKLGEHSVRIGASIGIAVFPMDASDAETLCIQADLRMYDAKHSTGGLGDESAQGGSQPSAKLHLKGAAKEQQVEPRTAALFARAGLPQ
jgi:diguanylate cyclase (GGDEF)-like protein